MSAWTSDIIKIPQFYVVTHHNAGAKTVRSPLKLTYKDHTESQYKRK